MTSGRWGSWSTSGNRGLPRTTAAAAASGSGLQLLGAGRRGRLRRLGPARRQGCWPSRVGGPQPVRAPDGPAGLSRPTGPPCALPGAAGAAVRGHPEVRAAAGRRQQARLPRLPGPADARGRPAPGPPGPRQPRGGLLLDQADAAGRGGRGRRPHGHRHPAAHERPLPRLQPAVPPAGRPRGAEHPAAVRVAGPRPVGRAHPGAGALGASRGRRRARLRRRRLGRARPQPRAGRQPDTPRSGGPPGSTRSGGASCAPPPPAHLGLHLAAAAGLRLRAAAMAAETPTVSVVVPTGPAGAAAPGRDGHPRADLPGPGRVPGRVRPE